MTRTHSFIRVRIMLGFLMLSAISILPSLARAQNCGDQGSPPVQVSVSVSPGSIIGWSGVTTLTETLNCTVASN